MSVSPERPRQQVGVPESRCTLLVDGAPFSRQNEGGGRYGEADERHRDDVVVGDPPWPQLTLVLRGESGREEIVLDEIHELMNRDPSQDDWFAYFGLLSALHGREGLDRSDKPRARHRSRPAWGR
jgi:hypothetical protein